ncbi:MAG TPA: hypothetical protein VFW92_05590 [Candidatus Limnocylindrales bacterium]|nr:hypothetical protein [Candidatus Limnocylindrales bacterium]
MTARVALIGHPLRRRHSQVMHDAAFEAAGIDARYELHDLEAEAVPGFVAQTYGPDWLGFQITAPYKQLVVGLLDSVEPAAASIGAVNSVVRSDDGRLIGFNTDATGFRAAVETTLGVKFRSSTVVVAGAGGAARAVVRACIDAQAARVVVAARSLRQAAGLIADLGPSADCDLGAALLDVAALAQALRQADLVVNATTVGMIDSGMVLPPEAFGPDTSVFDLVYVPRETPFVTAARDHGLKAANGEEMLIAQAAAAFERWTGHAGMESVMRAAVEPLLADPTALA